MDLNIFLNVSFCFSPANEENNNNKIASICLVYNNGNSCVWRTQSECFLGQSECWFLNTFLPWQNYSLERLIMSPSICVFSFIDSLLVVHHAFWVHLSSCTLTSALCDCNLPPKSKSNLKEKPKPTNQINQINKSENNNTHPPTLQKGKIL